MDEMSESNGAQAEYPAPAPTSAAPAQGGGYKICLLVKADGTFSVYKEDVAEEMREREAAAGSDHGDSISDFGDALRAAMQIYKENPIGESDQASFDAGFTGKRPNI